MLNRIPQRAIAGIALFVCLFWSLSGIGLAADRDSAAWLTAVENEVGSYATKHSWFDYALNFGTRVRSIGRLAGYPGLSTVYPGAKSYLGSPSDGALIHGDFEDAKAVIDEQHKTVLLNTERGLIFRQLLSRTSLMAPTQIPWRNLVSVNIAGITLGMTEIEVTKRLTPGHGSVTSRGHHRMLIAYAQDGPNCTATEIFEFLHGELSTIQIAYGC